MADRIVRTEEVLQRTGAGRTTLWRWQREGRFPRRRQIGPGIVGWLESEVTGWLESRPPVGTDEPQP